MFARPVVTALSLLLVAGLVGCTPTPPPIKTVPASGTVTLDGAPVSGAIVSFFPADGGGKPAGGETGPDGRFQLKTSTGGEKFADGAMNGEYKVTVVKSAAKSTPSGAPDPKSMEGLSEEERAAKMKELTGVPQGEDTRKGAPDGSEPTKSTLPAKFGDVKTSGLTASVKAGDKNDFTFDLKGE